jgi:ketopantoate reductase
VKFKSDPSLLSYGSGASDQRFVVESKPVPRHISPSDLAFMDTELAKESRGPIRSLILAVDSNSVVSSLLTYKERLKQDSTILFTQKGMGIMEMVNEQVFPDPSSGPNYMTGILSHQH